MSDHIKPVPWALVHQDDLPKLAAYPRLIAALKEARDTIRYLVDPNSAPYSVDPKKVDTDAYIEYLLGELGETVTTEEDHD